MSDLDSSYVIRYENPDGDPVYVVENAEGLIEFSNLTDGLDCLAAISSLSNGELVSIDDPVQPDDGDTIITGDLQPEPVVTTDVETEFVVEDPLAGSGGEYVEIQEVVEEEVIAEGSHDPNETTDLNDQDLIQQIMSYKTSLPGSIDSAIPSLPNLLENAHPLDLPTSPVYPCDSCNEKFTKKLHLMNHMITHQSEHLPHTCFKCSISFSRRSEFNTHMKIHSMENNDQLNLLQDLDEELGRFSRRKRNNSTRSNTSTSSTGRRRYTYSNSSSTSSRKRKHSTRLDDTFELDMLIKSAEKSSRSLENRLKWPVTSDSRPYVCQTCGLSFGREKALLNHNRIHIGDNSYECTICGESFYSVSALRDHTRAKHFTSFLTSPRGDIIRADKFEGGGGDLLPPHEQYGDFPCHICGQMYYRLDQFQRHERTHQPVVEDTDSRDTDECPQVCKQCGMYFENEDELRDHIKLHQPPSEPSVPVATTSATLDKTATDYINRCIVCNEHFASTELAVTHMKEVHGDELLDNICTICGQQFSDEALLLSHDCTEVSPPRSPAKSTRKKALQYTCDDCGKVFTSRPKLKRHTMAFHKPTASAARPAASKGPPASPASHMCEDCGEEYWDRQSLLVHKARHDVIRTERGRIFPCHDCGKTFNSRSSQQIHQRIHTGERPYSCRYCYKAFADGGTLRKHERVHTGEKPYVCPICSKAFNQRVVLREHIRAHHSGPESKGATTFECKVCGCMLSSSPELCQHLVQHSDENTAKNRVVPTAPRKYKRRRKLLPHEGDGFPDTDDDEEASASKSAPADGTDTKPSASLLQPPRKPTPEYDREFLEWEMKVGINSMDKAASPVKTKTKGAATRKQPSRRSHRSYASKYWVTAPPPDRDPSPRKSTPAKSHAAAAKTSATAADGLISLSSLAQVIAEREGCPSDSDETSARTHRKHDEDRLHEDIKALSAELIATDTTPPSGRPKRQYRRKNQHSKINVDLNHVMDQIPPDPLAKLEPEETPESIMDRIKQELIESSQDGQECIAESFINVVRSGVESGELTEEVEARTETIETWTHLESEGGQDPDGVGFARFHTCDMCSEVFADKEELMLHIKIHL